MTNSIMDFMGNDHDRLDGIFKEFRSRKHAKRPEAEKLFSEFKAGLERHIVWEEDILFPLFERHTRMYDEGPTAIMRMEHRLIKEILEKIQAKTLKKDTDTDMLETDLMETLTTHDQKEESVLYPWMDNYLSAKELEEAFAKMIPSSSQ